MAELPERLILEKWYEAYQGDDCHLALEAAKKDTLDKKSVQRRLKELMPSIQIQNGYCTICQRFLKSWLEKCLNSGESKRFWLSWHAEFIQLEAASRRRCHFCRLWMRDIGREHLQTARKLEKRLQSLGKPCSIAIETSFTARGRHYLYLCFPGQSYNLGRTTKAAWMNAVLENSSGLYLCF
jgi:hypothetical protein